LVLLHQTDANTFGLQHIYQFGNEFLVAPIIQPNSTTRDVYLPDGNWVDFWTNEHFAGGKNIAWKNPQQAQMPLFVRDGSIVPMLLNDVDTLCDSNYVANANVKTPDRGLLFLIFPGAASQFTVYDGTVVQCSPDAASVNVTISSLPRPVMTQIHIGEPKNVLRDGAALPRFTVPDQFQAVDIGWLFDADKKLLWVKFPHLGGTTHINANL
jgi:hypothetical protein